MKRLILILLFAFALGTGSAEAAEPCGAACPHATYQSTAPGEAVRSALPSRAAPRCVRRDSANVRSPRVTVRDEAMGYADRPPTPSVPVLRI